VPGVKETGRAPGALLGPSSRRRKLRGQKTLEPVLAGAKPGSLSKPAGSASAELNARTATRARSGKAGAASPASQPPPQRKSRRPCLRPAMQNRSTRAWRWAVDRRPIATGVFKRIEMALDVPSLIAHQFVASGRASCGLARVQQSWGSDWPSAQCSHCPGALLNHPDRPAAARWAFQTGTRALRDTAKSCGRLAWRLTSRSLHRSAPSPSPAQGQPGADRVGAAAKTPQHRSGQPKRAAGGRCNDAKKEKKRQPTTARRDLQQA